MKSIQQTLIILIVGFSCRCLSAGGHVSPALELPEQASQNWWGAAQENIANLEYHATEAFSETLQIGKALQAPNRAQNFRTWFTENGITVHQRTGDKSNWTFGLDFTGYGTIGNIEPVQKCSPEAYQNRVTYYGEQITQWFENSPAGLEQGFMINFPEDKNKIEIQLTQTGNLRSLLKDEKTLALFTESGAKILEYGNLWVFDSNGETLNSYFKLEGNVLSIIIHTEHAAYPIIVDPILSSEVEWTVQTDQEALFGWSVSTAGDVNGDGFSDVIVGAPSYDSGEVDEGRAFVYQGSSTGLSTSAAWTAESNQVSAQFGTSVSMAGDVNGDGYCDVIVGSPGYSNGQTSEGRAFVYYGSATGLGLTTVWQIESNKASARLGYSVSTAGDVNGDGYSDIIIGVPYYSFGYQTTDGLVVVYYGSSTGLDKFSVWSTQSDMYTARLGSSVSSAGDVNRDGFDDIVIGAPGYTNGQNLEGRAYVFHGSASGLGATAAWTAESNLANASFGSSVSTAGDVNGDGYADVIIGAPNYSDGENLEGKAYLYRGSSTGLGLSPSWSVETGWPDSEYGASVSTAGDLNGDGYSDIIVGVPGASGQGAIMAYLGSSVGLSADYDWFAVSDQAGADLGFSISNAGDVNGDGFADIIGGAPNYQNSASNHGRVFVYYGSAQELNRIPGWNAEPNQASAFFGWSVSNAGDVNGDGYSDVIVGAFNFDNGQAGEGRAFIYNGSATGLNNTHSWSGESNQVSAGFGFSVSSAGDVNRDGFSDVIVSANKFDNGETDEGRAFVFHGSPSGPGISPNWVAEGDQVSAFFGNSVSAAGDVNGDGFSDVIVGAYKYDHGETDEGRAYVFHGGTTGLSATPNWCVESDQPSSLFGQSVSGAGDVNGDGYSDVIVGAHNYTHGHSNEGAAFVYHGSALGLNTSADWMAESDQVSAFFGVSVSTAGDVNGDGFSDVIVGALGYDNGAETDDGSAFVYYGSASGLNASYGWTMGGLGSSAFFGCSVSTAGDVNGDGYSDIIIGSYGHNQNFPNEGRAVLLGGGMNGIDTSVWVALDSGQESARLGYCVSNAGDINGDGYSDVIVGVPYYDNIQTNEGRALVYFGNSGHGVSMKPVQAKSDGSIISPLGISNLTDGFRIRLNARTPFGRSWAALEWEVKPLGTLFDGTGINVSSAWTDTMDGSITFSETVTGLDSSTPYHWRARVLYLPGSFSGQHASRWFHPVHNGWNETDFRTRCSPPPSFYQALADWPVPQTVLTLMQLIECQ